MGDKIAWLKARKKHKQILLRLKKILGGSAIAALIVGPLIYFGVAAQETAQILEGDLRNKAVRESMATPEVKTNQKPIEFPKVDVKKPEKKEDLNIEIKQDKIPEKMQEPEVVTQTAAYEIFDEQKTQIASEFNKNKEDINIKTLDTNFDGLKEKSVILDEVSIDYGPVEIKQEPDANAAARTALQKYLNTLEEKDNYAVLKDTTKLDQIKQPDALVISSVVNHNGKWYANFTQYHNMLPVFDGNVKLIFTEKKKLLVLTDNIRRNLPTLEQFTVGTALAQQSTKELFEWDDETDKIQFINKGYYKEKPAYKVETEAHNPLGQWDVYVNGTDGSVEDLMSDIRTQDDPIPAEETTSVEPTPPTEEETAPTEEPILTEEPTTTETPVEPETTPAEETTTEVTPPEETSTETPVETPTETATEEPATTEPEILPPETTDETVATPEPEIEILQTLLGQVFGKIYPKTPNDPQEIIPFANEYIYINQNRVTTDEEGYFDNPTMSWYSLFLEGPYVTVTDDGASVNADIVDQTPEDPFTWDENTASLAAINAFYHTNKIREWAAANLLFEINDNIPVTVNSTLVDDYMTGCGAWFDTRDNTIEIGRGGYEGEINGIRSPCMNDLNYALSSDIIYHEYAHHIIESVTHLPNISGAESAAMGEGLADYFAATINDDSVWGDVISVRTRDLNNTLKYKYLDEAGQIIEGQTDMTGNAHYDGQILSGALWDLRTAIGAEATDKLVFNTLFQDRLHYETFMYGMIIEDDDNNDFSDGTPHLIAILESFENHGIGPGVLNFSGLPIDPEEWTKILQEAGYEGVEEPVIGAYAGTGCHVTGTDLDVYGGTCYIYGTATFNSIDVYNSGTCGILNVTGYNQTGGNVTTAITVTTTTTIQDSCDAYIGNQNHNYSASLTTPTMTVQEGSVLTVRYNFTAAINNYFNVNGLLTVTGTGSEVVLLDNTSASSIYSNADALIVDQSGAMTLGDSVFITPNTYYYPGCLDIHGITYIRNGGTITVVNAAPDGYTSYFYTDRLENGDGGNTGGTLTTQANTYTYVDNGPFNNYDYLSIVNNAGQLYVGASGNPQNFTLASDAAFTNTAPSARPFRVYGTTTMTSGSTFTNSGYAFFYSTTSATGTLSTNITTITNNTGGYMYHYVMTDMNTYSKYINSSGAGAVFYGELNMFSSVSLGTFPNQTDSYCKFDNDGTVYVGYSTYPTYDLKLDGFAMYKNNAGTTTVYDDVFMNEGETYDGNAIIHNVSGATFNVNGSADNELTMLWRSIIHNYGSFNVDKAATSSTTDGLTNVYSNDTNYSIIHNYGTYETNLLFIGNPVGSTIYSGGEYNNESGGTTNITKTGSTTTVTVYRGIVRNQPGATGFNANTGAGTIVLSGIADDEGQFLNYSAATASILVNSYGYGLYQNTSTGTTTSTGTNCWVYQTSSSDPNGQLVVKSTSGTAELTCSTLNLGLDNTALPGKLVIDAGGKIISTIAYIFEDATNPTQTYEVQINDTSVSGTYHGFFNPTTLNLGNALYTGGEIYNYAGDGTIAKDDTYDEGIYATNINMYAGGTIYNGATIDDGVAGFRDNSITNIYAEVIWDANLTTTITMYANSKFYNNGKIAPDLLQTSSSGIGGQAFYNREGGGTGGIVGMYTTDGNTKIKFYYGTFSNTGSNNRTQEAKTDVNTIELYGGATMNNSGTVTAQKLWVGDSLSTTGGGEFNNDQYGIFTANSTATDAGQNYIGHIHLQPGSDSFTIKGTMDVHGVHANPATLEVQSANLSPIVNATTFGELTIRGGTVTSNDDVIIEYDYASKGDLSIQADGVAGTYTQNAFPGLINTRRQLLVDRTTKIFNNSTLTINENRYSTVPDGFIGTGLTEVYAGGTITSDITSSFYFNGGITTAGTVETKDDIDATTLTVTAGTTTMGDPTNVGLSNITGKTTVSGGNLYTYNDADMHDIEVTGSGAYLYFNDSQTGGNCNTDVHGYFDILNGGTATVNCTTTSPNAVDVHAGSPGGTTVVEGTLVLNTNMETDDMIVDNEGTYCDSSPCVITHDIVGPVGNLFGYLESPASSVFILEVLDDLTINIDGSIDVSEKSYYQDLVTDHGGCHGGLGQANSWGNGYAYAYGQMNSIENEYGRRGFAAGPGFNYSGFGGGKATIAIGQTVGDGSSLILYGDILANGQTELGGAGSGGSINLISFGSMSGSGSILANGGNQTDGTLTNTAGGGGRIYIGYNDKSSYTGQVLALGGLEDTSTYAAGTGTIFYLPYDFWYNHNNGTLIIDANGQTLDVNNSGTTTKEDYTRPTEDFNIESVQLDRNGGIWVQANVNGTDLYYQQCIEANGGKFAVDSGASVFYNPEHDVLQTVECYGTPDPPYTLYVNNSKAKAQTNYPSTKASYATVADITPAVSAMHNDAELDRNPADQDTDSTVQYQLQIATSAALLYADSPDICDVDEQPLIVADDARSADIIVPYASCTLTADDYYYWRIRFKDNNSGANGWGLWSYTNWFYLDNGGTIEVTTCSSDTAPYDTIVLGDVAGATADRIVLPTGNFDEEYCTLKVESTTPIFVLANKSAEFTNGSEPLPDMPNYRERLLCRSAGNPLTDTEVAFRLYNVDGMFDAEQDPDNLSDFDAVAGDANCSATTTTACWHQLRTYINDAQRTKVLNSSAAILGNTFEFWLGACVMNDHPAGTYTSTGTLYLTSNP